MVSRITRTINTSSENSELVTFTSHSPHSTHHAEDQQMMSVSSRYQKFSEMLAAKGIARETITKFIQTSAGCVLLWHYWISEMLSSIAVVVNNAEEVFEMANTNELLQVIFGQVSVMMVSYSYVFIYNNYIRTLADHFIPRR